MAVIEARVTGTGQELCDQLGCPRRSRRDQRHGGGGEEEGGPVDARGGGTMIAPSDADSEPQSPPLRPLITVLLSLIAPGAGHLYTGRLFKGLALWLAGTVFGWLALLGGLAATFAGMVVLLVAAPTRSAWRFPPPLTHDERPAHGSVGADGSP